MADIAIEGGAEAPAEQEWIEPATPAARLWARLFDTWLLAVLISVMGGTALGLIDPRILDGSSMDSGAGNILLGIILLPIALLVDALIFSIFGNTIGKRLAGIRVERIDGQPAGGLALRRNLRVYVHGMCLGLPLLNLVAMTRARDRLLNEGATSWDEALGTRVVECGSNELRTIAVAVLAVAFQIASLFLANYVERRGPEWERESIVAALPDINRGLPRFVDDVTRFDRIDYRREEDVLSVEHTLIHHDGSPVDRREVAAGLAQARAMLIGDYCGPRFKAFRDLGIPVRYVYRFHGGGIGFETLFHADDCAAPPTLGHPAPPPAS